MSLERGELFAVREVPDDDSVATCTARREPAAVERGQAIDTSRVPLQHERPPRRRKSGSRLRFISGAVAFVHLCACWGRRLNNLGRNGGCTSRFGGGLDSGHCSRSDAALCLLRWLPVGADSASHRLLASVLQAASARDFLQIEKIVVWY